jgi:hypothetical protein
VYGRNREREGNTKLENVWCPHCRGANTVTLKWQRSLWESDWEVVKRSGRDEPIQVVIHMCMEAMLGISLYSCPYVKVAKMVHLSYHCLCLLLNKIGEEGWTGFAWKGLGAEEEGGGGGKQGEMALQCTLIWINKKNNNSRKFYFAPID